MKIEEQVLTIEQAKHLQSLGLDMGDAAFTWHTNLYTKDTHLGTGYLGRKRSVYTYTLQEVLQHIGCQVVVRQLSSDTWFCDYFPNDGTEVTVGACDALNAAYLALVNKLENGYERRS